MAIHGIDSGRLVLDLVWHLDRHSCHQTCPPKDEEDAVVTWHRLSPDRGFAGVIDP
jgi:hypothetical protein